MPNQPTLATMTLLLVTALACTSVDADAQNALNSKALDMTLLSNDVFLRDHPDLRYRRTADEAYQRGDYAQALENYRKSARFGDKLAQGRVAEMLWTGEGLEADRALAYIWMDLAAERGYRVVLALRERYWSELNASQRARVHAEGPAIYAEFGDAAAQPRMKRWLARGSRNVPGSRTGRLSSSADVIVRRNGTGGAPAIFSGPGGPGLVETSMISFRADRYYDPAYWDPKLYWQWKDLSFDKVPVGEVDVGGPTAVDR